MDSAETAFILVVDDNRVNRLVLEKRLEQEGYAVRSASDGAEALDKIGLGDNGGGGLAFDAIVLDVMMPEIDGLEVLQRIREVKSANELPVIMATARDQSTDIVKALDLGANDYVVKPIDMPVLLARLKTQVSLKQTHSALKEAQKSLIEAAKMESVGYLAAGVAHEIRNPLAQILMGMEAIRGSDAMAADGDLESVLEIMGAAVKKADAITRELMRVSTSGELELQPEPVNELVAEAWESVEAAAKEAGVETTFDYGDALPDVAVAAAELRSAITSILTNSVEAMSENGSLAITTRAANARGIARDVGTRSGRHLRDGEECIVIEITDTGPGIPPEKLSSIFDPFFTSKATGKGTGLGLSVAKKLVELHNGTISLENRTERSGVRAILQLPKAETQRSTV